MLKFFQKVPISIRLVIIGIIPVIFLSYFSYLIFQEKNLKIDLIEENIRKVGESKIAQELLSNLAYERRYSFNYLHQIKEADKLQQQRKKTDSAILLLEKRNAEFLPGFDKYHFLDELRSFRTLIDDDSKMDPNVVIQFYTDLIYRVNSMNTPSPPIGLFSFEVYQEFVSQKILNDLITYLSLLRTQIYTYLDSEATIRPLIIENSGVYKTYRSLEREFLLKSAPSAIEKYDSLKSTPDYKTTIDEIDSIYLSPGYIYHSSPEVWFTSSAGALLLLRAQQQEIWQDMNASLNKTKQKEIAKRNISLLFLVLSVAIIALILFMFGMNLIKTLDSLALSANKISQGATDITVQNVAGGSIGILGDSILNIRNYTLQLSDAANEIGKGNFNVTVTPRSDDDILGRSIKKMKQDLREYAEQKDKIQRETMELVHQRDDFFNITSHELKTPITSLKAYAQLLLMEYSRENSSTQQMMVEKMEQQINKLIILINNLLDTSKIQNGQFSYENKEIKFNHLIQDCVRKCNLSHPDFKVIFQKNMNCKVFGDPARLSQVVDNILANAVKYSMSSKEAIVRLEKTDHEVICSIRDFGVGIKPEEKARIFEKFYRVTSEYMHTYPGIGLGLYLSSEIIANHQGKLWVESDFGKGSTFYFTLPLFDNV